MEQDFWTGDVILVLMGIVVVCFAFSGTIWWVERLLSKRRYIAAENLTVQAEELSNKLRKLIAARQSRHASMIPHDLLSRNLLYSIHIESAHNRRDVERLREIVAQLRIDIVVVSEIPLPTPIP